MANDGHIGAVDTRFVTNATTLALISGAEIKPPTNAATANTGGVWIDDTATTPVLVRSVTTQGGAAAISGQGDLLIGAVNADTGSVTLNSATGAVLDGISGGSSRWNPNVIAGAFTAHAPDGVGTASDPFWVVLRAR